MITLTAKEIHAAVAAALAEDVGSGDVTTLATIPARSRSAARLVAREPHVVAGIEFAVAAFRQLARGVKVENCVSDGQHARKGKCLLRLTGPTRALLTAERVALNFVQRLSGIATLTARYVAAVKGTSTRILDTRKTTPGWRRFEKYAVACGGGENHRQGLHDMVLIKDNHLAALKHALPDPIAAALARARRLYPRLKLEVETDTLRQVEQAARAGADFILLDNMSPAKLRRAVTCVAGRAFTEASGGITLATVRSVAQTGVDFISIGALTHSPAAVDIGLDFEKASPR